MSATPDLLNDLADEQKPLEPSLLLQLSGLTSEEEADFRDGWPVISVGRKRQILSTLSELGEDNVELDFSAAFLASLQDADEQVRELSALGLWECDDRTAIRPLISLLLDDPSPRAKAAAGRSLGKFARMAQEGKLIPRDGDRLRDALLAVVDNREEDVEVRRRAVEAVATFDSPEIDQIIQDAYGDDDPRLRQSALFAMGRSSNSKWIDTLFREVAHEDAAIRYEAANALGQLTEESAVPHLASLLDDHDPQVQLAAVRALGNIGGRLAKRALLQCIREGDEALEEAAQEALGSIEFDEDPLSFRYDL